jgi:carbon-monoxide dehydrogenase large subunit
VVNAVVDALAPFGVQDVTMPCTPQRVWKAVHQGGGGRGTEGTPEQSQPHFEADTSGPTSEGVTP